MPELKRSQINIPASRRLLARWLLLGEWRAHPVRALVAILAIAIGVALGFAIHLINAAAFNEFSTAVKSLSGQADVQVAGREALFDESIYPWLAQHDGVTVASPVLDLQAAVARKKDGGPLHILALDVFRAGFISPDLIGAPAEGQPFDTLADDALFLSPAALRWLGVAQGDTIALQSGTGQVPLRVAGSLQRARRPAHRRDGYRRGAVALQQAGQAVAHRSETAPGRQPRRLPGGSRAHTGSPIPGAFPGGPAE